MTRVLEGLLLRLRALVSHRGCPAGPTHKYRRHPLLFRRCRRRGLPAPLPLCSPSTAESAAATATWLAAASSRLDGPCGVKLTPSATATVANLGRRTLVCLWGVVASGTVDPWRVSAIAHPPVLQNRNRGQSERRTCAPVADSVDAVQRNLIVSASYHGGSATTTLLAPAGIESRRTSQHAKVIPSR
jgi:hypothetical protein